MNRREILKLVPASVAGLAGTANYSLSQKLPYNQYAPITHEPLAIQYTKKTRDMLMLIRETQSENLLEASYILADTIMGKGTCWCAWDMGHNTNFDMFPERNGVPKIITMGYDAKKTKKGDCFLASIWGGPHEDLVKKEIVVIGGPAPWGGDAQGSEFLRPDVREQKLKPYADVWIETNITTHGALMHLPGSAAPFGPASGIIGLTTFWMMNADACRILARNGKPVQVQGDEPELTGDNLPWVSLRDPLMDDYFEQVMLQIEMIGAELGDIQRIAETAVDAVLSGGKVYCYSRYRNSLCVEGHHRRGGLALTRGLCEMDGVLTALGSDSFECSSKDLVIMGIWEPDDEVDFKYLDVFRRSGAKVVSMGPMMRNLKIPEGRTIPKETDIHVGRMCDTCGLYAVPGFKRKVCPTSGVLINQIWWATCMEIADLLIKRTGNTPGVFLSAAIEGGREHNNYIMAKLNERGY